MRKQVVTLRVSPGQSVASVQTCSSFSTLCPQARLQVSHRPQFSLPTLPTRQSRTFLTHLRHQAQALKTPPTPATSAKTPSPDLQLTNLPYFVRRTASNTLPVYTDVKAGGTKKLTKIQKTEGDLDALRNDLALALGVADGNKPNPEVTLNRLTGHIIVKVCLATAVVLYSSKYSYIVQGWRKPEIVKFLQERRF
ncbi:Ribosomal protein L49/IMG2 [Penicillium soppii]|uniref:Ribosomal protein L49/IMG2 n=1 Tax=Penicillium soppii TaxID=69789 RepID=UPI0025476BC6|nr:Ribosomal protein L49/IMG2 [Penicillium soppii]KAJ5861650.1 Ribosomal protein L49/IMG2 [Penicillium soppii]